MTATAFTLGRMRAMTWGVPVPWSVSWGRGMGRHGVSPLVRKRPGTGDPPTIRKIGTLAPES